MQHYEPKDYHLKFIKTFIYSINLTIQKLFNTLISFITYEPKYYIYIDLHLKK